MRKALLITGLLACVTHGHAVRLSKAAQSATAALHPNVIPFLSRHPNCINASRWARSPMMVDEGPRRGYRESRRLLVPAITRLKDAKCSRKQTLAAFASCVLVGSPCASLAATQGLRERTAEASRAAAALRSLKQQERTVEDLFTQAAPSVVFITTFRQGLDTVTMDPVEVREGTGSGFVWDSDGHIVTNYHVVRGAKNVTVAVIKEAGGKPLTFDASLVGYNPEKDIAVLQMDMKNVSAAASLAPIPIGSSKQLRVGATTLAIGNPFGLDHTLTVGVVSGLGREVKAVSGVPLRDMIQTDAAINPGSSGGALLDSDGKLIGMNTAIFSTSGTSAGVAFALPVDTIKEQTEIIIRDGKVVRASLGIKVLGSQARAFGIQRGVLVAEAPPNSNAAKAGLRAGFRGGDVILKLNDNSIEKVADLDRALDDCMPGQDVRLTVLRLLSTLDGSQETEMELVVKLEAYAAK